MEMLEYSVVVPVLNEVGSLEELTAKIETVMNKISNSWELIFVDDGSSDGSFEKIVQLKKRYPFIRGLRFDRNHGQTAAMAAGIKAARGKIIITLDADLQNDPNDIPHLLKHLNSADAVIGWRKQRNDPLIRRLSGRFANWFRNLIIDDNIHDIGCSLKAFKAEKIKAVPLFEGMHRFFPTLIKIAGGKVVEVPVSHHSRLYGSSKYNIFNRVFKSFLDLLAVQWMKWRTLRYKVIDEI